MKTGRIDFPLRGSVWLISLEPVMGAEIGMTRPAVIISNDINNRYSDTITIVPVTSNTDRMYPFEVKIFGGSCGLNLDSKVKANQIRTVDKKRLVKMLGLLSDDILVQLENAVKIHLSFK
ncbi:MAG: type II toxin-antitoxin system PemK/MazF family toxin [Candidatus Eremiobacterota bacterium]